MRDRPHDIAPHRARNRTCTPPARAFRAASGDFPQRARAILLKPVCGRPAIVVFGANRHRRAAPSGAVAALQILAMPPDIAAVCALPRARLRRHVDTARHGTRHQVRENAVRGHV